MINFVVGKPGGGKSLYACLELLKELRTSNRCIITNLALRMEPWVDGKGVPRKGLVRTVKDKYGDSFDAERRVKVLTDQEVKRFFLFRRRIRYDGSVEEKVVESVRERVGDSNKIHERFFLEGEWGCLYIIDEVHEFYNARMWAETGTLVLSWASQSRRCGDDALLLTQHPDFVETNLKKAAQQCTVLTNHRLMSASIFRQPDMISYRDYSVIPPKRGDPSMRSGKLRYDRQEIYGCYDTAAGVGVSGASADIGKRARGLHWSTFPMVAVIIILLLSFGCREINNRVLPGVVKMPSLGPKKLPEQKQTPAANPEPVKKQISKVVANGDERTEPGVYYAASTCLNGKLKVYLSNGRVLNQSQVILLEDDKVTTTEGIYYVNRHNNPVVNIPKRNNHKN